MSDNIQDDIHTQTPDADDISSKPSATAEGPAPEMKSAESGGPHNAPYGQPGAPYNAPYGQPGAPYNAPYGQPGGPYYGPAYYRQPPVPKDGFASASMICGVLSLGSFFTLLFPLPLGALGILFSRLSVRKGRMPHPQAKTGMLLSVLGAVAGLIIGVSSVFSVGKMLDPDNRDQLNQTFEKAYGMDYEQYMRNIYGDDYDAIQEQLDKLFDH